MSIRESSEWLLTELQKLQEISYSDVLRRIAKSEKVAVLLK